MRPRPPHRQNTEAPGRAEQCVPRARFARLAVLLLCSLALSAGGGCSQVLSTLGNDPAGAARGATFYLGGAGTFGNIGNYSIREGLRDGGYTGAIDVVPWQSWFGDVLRDQMDRTRNEREAQRFADRITEYARQYPGRRANIIALSAGTGVATWAIERLPPDVRVGTVVFLGSSLSRRYDLTEALSRLDGKLYVFYSADDPVLRYGVPLAGTVDRDADNRTAAGLTGFALPRAADAATVDAYNRKLRNMGWKPRYARYGYRGLHTDGTRERFVAAVIAPLLREPLDPREPAASQETAAAPAPDTPAAAANTGD
ncbi:MAG: hypothetical protein IPM64_13925 [Phycisphaerales bacterium]|nr:hypothetical protein [Phycisphaerales bacterium]